MATWTNEEDAAIRQMAADGLSASQIAAAIGNGRTRNAVIGRIMRMQGRGVQVRLGEHRPMKPREARATSRRNWTPEELDKLATMWADDRPIREIALAIGRAETAIGTKANERRDLCPRRGPTVRIPGQFAGAASKPKQYAEKTYGISFEQHERNAYDATALNVELMDLGRHQCKWPVNTPPPRGIFLFCGHDRKPGHSYCPHHVARAGGRFTVAEREDVAVAA